MDTFQLAGIRKGAHYGISCKRPGGPADLRRSQAGSRRFKCFKPYLWVNVMEILDTPRSLNEGELVVSTGYGLEDQSLHKDLIHQLKKRRGQRSGDPAGLLYRSDPGIHYRRRKQGRTAGAGTAGTAVIFRDPSCAYGSDHGKQSYFQKAGPGTGHTAHCTWKKN